MRAEPGAVSVCRVDDRSAPERGHHELRVIFASTPLAVRDALHSTLSGLRSLNLTDAEAMTVELVLAEVMNNIVEHSYLDDRTGMIEFQVVHGADGLMCTVLDDGHEMPDGNPPVGLPPDPDQPIQMQPEGGFGWFLIRTLAEDLVYRRDGNRNRLSFRLPVARSFRQT